MHLTDNPKSSTIDLDRRGVLRIEAIHFSGVSVSKGGTVKSSQAGRCLAAFLLCLFVAPALFSQVIIRERITINPTPTPQANPMAIGSREWDIVNGYCWQFYLNPSLPPGDMENEYRWLMYGDDGYVYDLWTDMSDASSIDFTDGAALVDVFDAQTGDTVGTTNLPGKQYRFRLKEPHPTSDQLYIRYRVTYDFGGDIYAFVVHTLFIRPTFVLTASASPAEIQAGGSTSISIDAVNNCYKDHGERRYGRCDCEHRSSPRFYE